MRVRGKRAGELRQSKKDKDAAAAAAAAEKQMDAGEVPAEQQEPPPKPNLTHDQYLITLAQQPKEALKRHDSEISDLRSQLKTAVSDRSNFLLKIKKEYGGNAIADLKKMVVLEDPAKEGAIKEDIERTLMIAKFLATPIGTQFELLVDRTPDVDRAYNEGLSDGRQRKEPNYNKWGQGTAQRQFYERGFEQGGVERNELLAQGYKATEPPPIGDASATHTDAESGVTHAEEIGMAEPPEWPVDGQPPVPRTETEQQQAAE